MNKTFTNLLLVAACAGCFSACIKEDWSDCPPPQEPEEPKPTQGIARLQLDYKMHNYKEGTEYADRFIEEVHKVDVFVFNSEGEFVRRDIAVVDPEQPEPYTLSLDYPAGDYRFIVWGNFNDAENQCTGGAQVPFESSAMQLLCADDSARSISLLADSLFHGMTPNPVTITAGEEQTIPIGLMDLITRIEQYNTQEALDREDHYLIELLFECEHEAVNPDPDLDPDPDPDPDPNPPIIYWMEHSTFTTTPKKNADVLFEDQSIEVEYKRTSDNLKSEKESFTDVLAKAGVSYYPFENEKGVDVGKWENFAADGSVLNITYTQNGSQRT